MCRSLHKNMATKEQNGLKVKKEFLPVCSIADAAIERTYGRTQRGGSNAGPVSSYLTLLPSWLYDSIASSYAPWRLFAFEHGVYIRTHASVRSNAWLAFKCRPVTCQHISFL
jgi:hypothetical protein